MQQTLCFCNWRKFGSQISDNMDRWKADLGRVREEKRTKEKTRRREKISEEKESEERRSRCAKRWKGAFPMICGPGGSKSRLAKAAGAEPSGQMRDEKLHAAVARSKFASEKVEGTSRWERFWKLSPHAVVARSTFRNQKRKNWRVWSTFGSWDVEKVHAVVARSTFGSQHVQNTPRSEHLWKFSCSKCVRRCGAKHISKSTCTKHQPRSTFGSWDVEKVHDVVARSKFRSQKWKKLTGSDHFWTFRFRCAWQAQGIVHLVKSEKNVRVLWQFQLQPPLHYTPLHSTTLQLQLHDATLHFITLHYNYNDNYITVTLRYTTLITLHYATLTTLHYTKYITLRYTPLHYTTLHYTNNTTLQLQLQLQLHCTALHCATLTTTTTTAAPNHTTSSSCGWGDRPGDHCNHCNHFTKRNSNHLSVHQWIRSAIRDSQQPSSPIGFLFLKLPPPPCAVLLVYNDYQWLI